MNMLISWLYIFVIGALFIVIPAIIGIYVYRDATQRGMNATLWTLIAVLAPTFIGLIVYLIVRAEHTALQCPKCKGPVTEQFTVCPHCGTPLKNKCTKCGNPLEATWANCPNCGETVPENLEAPVVAVQKDKGLGKILLAVILIPLLVMLVLVFGLVNFRGENNTSVSTAAGLQVEDFANNKEVSEWLKTCDKLGDGTYVLASVPEMTRGEVNTQSYIIYRTGLTSNLNTVYTSPRELFRKSSLKVMYSSTDEGTLPVHQTIDIVEYFGPETSLEIYDNGQLINYNLDTTDTPLQIGEPIGSNGDATNLYSARMEYLGDNSGVISLIDETGLSGIGPYSIELETEKKPYGLRILFDSVPKDFEMIDFSSNAIELLGLIKNLDYVEITNGEHSYTLTAEEATQTLGFDVKELGQSQEKLEDYLRSLQESIND